MKKLQYSDLSHVHDSLFLLREIEQAVLILTEEQLNIKLDPEIG
jgi:hypothetical protein